MRLRLKVLVFCAALACLVSAAAVSACGTDYSSSSIPDAGGGEAAAADEAGADGAVSFDGGSGPLTTRDGACAQAKAACLAVPTSWEGPLTQVTGEAGCAGDYSNEVEKKVGDVDAAPLACGCTCDLSPPGTDANAPQACSYQYSVNIGATCSALVPYGKSLGCSQSGGGGGSYSAMYEVAATPPASCRTSLPIGTPANVEAHVCSPAAPPAREGCNLGELCAPTSQTVCVRSEGDLPCPPGLPARTVLYDTVSDTRGCGGECGCSVTQQPSCASPSAVFFPDTASCADGGPNGVTLTPDVCTTLASNLYSIRFGGHLAGGACAVVSDAGPTGSVATTGATTVCCVSP